MFRKNERHQQVGLYETVEQLPEKQRLRLEQSWAGTFYRDLFSRIDESLLAKLYSDKASRPNTAVNVLIGMEVLKAGFGWSDEELYDAFLFDLQVRYALGIRDLASGNFELRTLYNFRQRLSRHMQEQGENLLERVFAQVTGEQLAAFGLKTGEQRMDATYIESNIRQMSRLQLLVEILQRVWRMLDEADRATYGALWAAYVEGTAGQFCYRVRKADVLAQLQAVGVLMQRLVGALASKYGQQPAYEMLQQVLSEHFTLQGETAQAEVQVKPNSELSADTLQSPDDREATFRQVGTQNHRGYKANLTETCAPDNPFQLVTCVQVAPNLTDDQQLMREAVPDLQQRTSLTTLWTDGGFTGQQARDVVRDTAIRQIPTGVRGGSDLTDGRLGWDEFEWELDAEGRAQWVTCPGGQRVPVVPAPHERCRAHFEATRCAACALVARCRAKPAHSKLRYTLYLTFRRVQVAISRQICHAAQGPGRNRRAAVESLMRSIKHPFGGQRGKLPVRGKVRITLLITASALMVNVRRIWRFRRQATESQPDDPSMPPPGRRPRNRGWRPAQPQAAAASMPPPGGRPQDRRLALPRLLVHLSPVGVMAPLTP